MKKGIQNINSKYLLLMWLAGKGVFITKTCDRQQIQSIFYTLYTCVCATNVVHKLCPSKNSRYDK
jgi:uncharacterized protein YgiB involved in biofilm formation